MQTLEGAVMTQEVEFLPPAPGYPDWVLRSNFSLQVSGDIWEVDKSILSLPLFPSLSFPPTVLPFQIKIF